MFALGPRIGQFMDGTFGHAVADFDAPIAPAADTADNNVNVVPFADFTNHAMYQLMTSMSSGATLPDTSPFLAMTTYFIRPGEEEIFEQAVARVQNASARETWYRLQVGGTAPRYILMRAIATFGAAATLGTPYTAMGGVQKVENELLRYRPNLSYRP